MFHGWKVVATAFLVALFGWGLGFYGSGVYLATLAESRGWPTGSVGAAITGYYLLGAAAITTIPRLIERFGERTVVLGGSLAMAVGVLSLSRVSELWQIWPAFLAMSCGWAAMSGVMVNALIAPWFDRRLWFAISLALNGASCGGVIVVPLMILAIERFGFTAGVGLVVVAMLLTLWPAAFAFLGRSPTRFDLARDGGPADAADAAGQRAGPAPPPTARALLRVPALRTVIVAFALGLFAQVGFLTHLVAFLTPTLDPATVSLAVGLTTGAAIVGRVATGLVIDRIDPRVATAATLAVQIAALSSLAAGVGPWAMLAACTAFGLGVGNLITLPSLIVRRELPMAAFTRSVGLIVAGTQVTYAFAPLLIGVLRDAQGDYQTAWWLCAGIDLAAAAVVLIRR